MKYDVAIVGAGPAGCLAAKNNSGSDVVLIEEHERQPVHCAGLISKSGIDVLGLDSSIALNKIRGAMLFSPGGGITEVSPKKVKAYVFDRSQFDQKLLVDAIDGGAEHVCAKVDAVTSRKVNAGGNIYEYNRLVLATGTDYRLPRSLGFEAPKRFLVGAQYDIKVDCVPDMVELHFVVPGFFAWIIPVDGIARVGTACYQNPTPFLESFIKRLGKAGRVKKSVASNPVYGIIPVHEPGLFTELDNAVILGDAAGQVKATTGGGVIMGGLAARHSGKKGYDNLWRQEIGRELRLHLMIHTILSRLHPKRLDKLLSLAGQYHENLEARGDMDYASKTLSSLFKNPAFTLKLIAQAPWMLFDMM